MVGDHKQLNTLDASPRSVEQAALPPAKKEEKRPTGQETESPRTVADVELF